MSCEITAYHEQWPLSRPFKISRGAKSAADVVVAEIRSGDAAGFGEGVPYRRYGESVESVLDEIESIREHVRNGLERSDLAHVLRPGAARNAVDCALWDLQAQRSGIPIPALLGALPQRLKTAVTISLDEPASMAAAAQVADAPLLKIKVDARAPAACVAAVRTAAPRAELIVDPNESWSPEEFLRLTPQMAELGVALLEQPIPADLDAVLEGAAPAVPVCADEAVHVRQDLARIARRYQAVNIKLDKSGGLTEALALAQDARELGLSIMAGCMVCTSLSVAPALFIARMADFIDLDGPWWLAEDRPDHVLIDRGWLAPSKSGWGIPRSA